MNMHKYWMLIWFIIGVTVGLLIPSGPAHGETVCGNRDKILKSLEKTYSEKLVSVGLTAGGGVIEVMVSPTDTWTILLTLPGGPTCVMAAGEAWEDLPGQRLTPEGLPEGLSLDPAGPET